MGAQLAPTPVVGLLDALSANPSRAGIDALEAAILTRPEHATKEDYLTGHLLHGGLYVRTILIPEGNLIVGHTHRADHVNFLLAGTIQVWTEDGMQVLKGPAIVPGYAGRKRAGIALTDVVWTTTGRTEAGTVEDAEIALIEPAACLTIQSGGESWPS